MPSLEIELTSGRVRGAVQGGVASFLGIPYGADTRPRRFRPPLPVEPWIGVRDATTFGPSCPQVRFTEEGDAAALKWLEFPVGGSPVQGGAMSEDCLCINLWIPTRSASEPRAVLVWLHGGGFTNGSGNEGWVNGDRLAEAENIIVITVTHRLGMFGFLDLRDEEHGGIASSVNAGMLDIVLALEWVRDNIAAFGGDPTRVTIAGQSGGAGKVAALTAMPAARGLFARAIMQSGPVSSFPGADVTGATTTKILSALGAPSLAELESMTWEELLAGQAAAFEGLDGSVLLSMDSIPGMSPSLDPRDLPAQPFTGEDQSGTHLMIGHTTHELSSLLAGTPIFSTLMDREQCVGLLDHFAPGEGEARYAAAEAEAGSEPAHLVLARAFVAQGFAGETEKIATAVTSAGGSVWQYRFEQPTEALDGLLGSCHALDIPYVFGTTDRSPLTGRMPGRASLSARMMRAWAGFVRTGQPAADGWERWSDDARPVHRFFEAADSLPIAPDRRVGAESPAAYDPARTPLGTLLKDPATRAIIDELVPDLPKHPMIGLAKAMPLDKVLEMSGDAVDGDTADHLRARIRELAPAPQSTGRSKQPSVRTGILSRLVAPFRRDRNQAR